MQAHEQTQFLRAVGLFVSEQVRLANEPLLEKIRHLENMIAAMASAGRDQRQEFEARIAAIPAGKNGAQGKDGAPGKHGSDGLNVDLASVHAVIEDAVDNAVAKLPVPPAPVGVVGGYIDRHGNLCHTLSDGSIKTLGLVVGRDGKDIDPYLAEAKLKELFDKWPKPQDGIDGKDGKDGRDGFGFEHFDMQFEDGKFYLLFQRGDELRKFLLPHISYHGVWKQGEYQVGNCVTYDGSQFIARRSTTTEPMTKDNDWQLCVKRGRDGKQGERGLPGKDGKDGRPGRDLTQLGPDGSKW